MERGHVICNSGAGTKNKCNQRKDRQTVYPKCSLFGTEAETVLHLVSACPNLAQKEYTKEDMTKLQ